MILSENTTLTGNGIGTLTDAVSAVVTHEINGQYELMMTYPVTGIHYADLEENRIIWAEPDNMTAQQAFRIYRITRPLNGIVTVYARHLAYDMSGIIVEPYTASSLQTALSGITSHCVPSCPFTFTTSRAVASPFTVSQPTALWSLLGGQQGSFLDVYGGEWAFDNYAATLTSHLGADRGVSVRYGKNMTELEQDLTIEATYVGIYPFWYDEETDTLVNLPEKIITTTGTGNRILILDCSSDFDTQPTVAQLRTKANTYITANNIGEPQISWKVSFAQLAQDPQYASIAALEQVQLGDTIKVYYEPMELEASSRAVKIEYDVLMQRYKSVTLGRVKQNLAAIVAGTNGEIQKAVSAARTALDRAIENSTDFIKNGTGYMRFIYNSSGDLMEIVSLDNPDINLAQKVWRWNNGGFGFSSTGYNGTYTTAITQDGSIVADFITTGTLNAARIKAGVLADEAGKFSLNLVTGELHIEQLDVVAEKLSNIGGRNLIINTLNPVVSPTADRPKILGQEGGTVVGGSARTAEHGICSVSTTQVFTYIRFGATSGSMSGLTAGQTYTLSADVSWTVLSAYTGTTKYAIRVAQYDDHTGTMALNAFFDIEPDATTNKTGSARCVFTFTPHKDATQAFIRFQCTDGTGTDYDTTDYLEAANLKLERGEVATDWTPAPEDDADAISSLSGKVDIQAGKVALVVEEKDGTNVIKTASIVTAINDDSSVTINGSRINLEGAVTISSLDDATQAALITGTTTKMQYYLSTSASSATGGTWYDSPNSLTWSSGKYVWTRVATTKTYASGTSTTTYSTAVYDKQLTTALSTASTAKSTADGSLSSTVSCYYRSTSSTAPAKPTSAVTATSQDTDKAWTLLMPRPKKSRYYYTCEQYTTNDGTVSWSTVRTVANANYTAMWCSASDQSYIDGGAIYAHSVTADQIAANTITAAEIAAQTITADRINLTDLFSQNITATNMNITGGYVNITGLSSSETSRITLGAADGRISTMSPIGFRLQYKYEEGSVITTAPLAYLYSFGPGTSAASNSYGYLSLMTNNSDASANLEPNSMILKSSLTSRLQASDSSVSLTDGTSTGTLSKTLISLTDGAKTCSFGTANGLVMDDGTKAYSFGTANGLLMYAGSSKYSALIWPDSNGAGRLVLGDGTSTKWRTELTNSGLVFRNASDSVTASYPADKANALLSNSSSATALSSGSYITLCTLTLGVGLWMIGGDIRYVANATGYRSVTISTSQNSGTSYLGYGYNNMTALSGVTTNVQIVRYANLSTSTTLYLNAYQNSGGNLNGTGYFWALKIA